MNTTFNELNLNSNIIEGLKKQNITTPTEIQTLTYPKTIK